MSSIDDYTKSYNNQKVSNMNSLFGTGSGSSVNVGGGISGDMLQQWALLGANTSAYKKLLQAEASGGVTKGAHTTPILNSDRFYNDNFDTETGKIKKATYTPVSTSTPKIAEDATSGDILSDMRALALNAIGNSKGLTQNQYDLFEQMRQKIAGGLVTGKKSSDTEVVTGEATPATLTLKDQFRYLEDDQTFTVAGAKGEKEYSFALGTSIEDIAKAINADSAATGISAEATVNESGTVSLELKSATTGKDSFVRVDQKTGSLFTEAGASASAKGADATTDKAETVVTGDDTQAALVAGLYKGRTMEEVAFTLQGAKGQQSFSFEHGATAQDIVSAINDSTAKTGIKAEVIFNAETGEAEGIGLLADKAGVGNYVQATMDQGSLFGVQGRTVSVAGSSKSSESTSATPAINNLEDLGRVTVGDNTYSFADLAPGGKASLEKNPDAALAVLDQAIKEIYSGLAKIKDFDPSETYIAGVTDTSGGASASTNAKEVGNYGSDAMTNWLNQYIKKSS